MHSGSKYSQAIALRQKGRSLGDIAKELSVSKSTASLWVRNIPLSLNQKKLLKERSRNAGREKFKQAAQKRHVDFVQKIAAAQNDAQKDIGTLSNKEHFMVGLGLYWGEGYKKGSNELGFTNSDKKIIQFYIQWLERHFSITKSDLILRVTINIVHAQRKDEIVRYWSEITGTEEGQFSKTSFVKTKQHREYKNLNQHFGTLRVKVRNGAPLRARILRAIELVSK